MSIVGAEVKQNSFPRPNISQEKKPHNVTLDKARKIVQNAKKALSHPFKTMEWGLGWKFLLTTGFMLLFLVLTFALMESVVILSVLCGVLCFACFILAIRFFVEWMMAL